jgi:hypothetical protein
MKKWKIVISQNAWEYEGYAIIKAEIVERVEDSNKALLADGVYIEFDEQIRDPELLSESE